jgi:Tol biopolymer transport system component
VPAAAVQRSHGAGEKERKTKVFISYSRRDVAFADRLEAALKARGIEVLIDRSDIHAFEDWWKRIEALIVNADTVAFVLSPDAVTSEVALKEVTFAASLNKRFAPIVWRRVEDEAIPEPLRRLNFIFFDEETRFEASADQVADALSIDINWIRKHTEFGDAARRWDRDGRSSGLLLRPPVLEEAERWIASRPVDAPAPTDETQAFITESRRAATRRRNVLTGSLAAGFAGAIALAGLAFWQRTIAVENEARAIAGEEQARRNEAQARSERDQALRTQSLLLADRALQRRAAGDAGAALLLALEALPDAAAGTSRPYVPEAEFALDSAWWARRERVVLEGHEDAVTSAAFSPDGKRIVTASDDRTARLWDAETGQPIGEPLQGHKSDVQSAAFSPDGKRIVTASWDRTARLWDAGTGQPIGEPLRGHEDRLWSAAFSPDGKRIVTASKDKTVRLWDAETGQPIGEPLRGHESDVQSAAFSPDGKRIVTASKDETARLWDVATGRQIGEPLRGLGAMSSAAFSPDGKRIVTASTLEGIARLWDAETGRPIGATLAHHKLSVTSAAFSPDGRRIVTTSMDKTARLSDAETGKPIAEPLTGHEDWVQSAAFSPDGRRIVTVSKDMTARLYEISAN